MLSDFDGAAVKWESSLAVGLDLGVFRMKSESPWHQ